jgi:hypothetical protein
VLGQKGNESQTKKENKKKAQHKLLENLCPTNKQNGKSLVTSKAPEKERERWSSIGAAFLHATQINDFIGPN